MQISTIGADGVLYNLSSVVLNQAGKVSLSVGAGLPVNVSFGDLIQLDLTGAVGITITTTISIKGK